MIQLKQKNEKWLLTVNETWQFDSYEACSEILTELMENKRKFGRVSDL